MKFSPMWPKTRMKSYPSATPAWNTSPWAYAIGIELHSSPGRTLFRRARPGTHGVLTLAHPPFARNPELRSSPRTPHPPCLCPRRVLGIYSRSSRPASALTEFALRLALNLRGLAALLARTPALSRAPALARALGSLPPRPRSLPSAPLPPPTAPARPAVVPVPGPLTGPREAQNRSPLS